MAPRLDRRAILRLIRVALQEDAASRDATSIAVIPADTRIEAAIVAKAPGIVSGGPVAVWTFHTNDASLRCAIRRKDGWPVRRGDVILTVQGRARSIFAAERVALNLLGHLSGIATLTAHYVRCVRGTRAQILDTRKTLPGLRALEKYAVRVGGGRNHRSGLSEAILIKTNHLRALKQGTGKFGMRNAECGMLIQNAVTRAKRLRPQRFVEIEVTSLGEFKAAMQARPNAILLDNWTLPDIRTAVSLSYSAPRTPHPALKLEVSGGVTLANVRAIAKTGVDRISIGRLTHSAPSLDISLRVVSNVE